MSICLSSHGEGKDGDFVVVEMELAVICMDCSRFGFDADIKCNVCNGIGWILTDKGKQLLKFLKIFKKQIEEG